MNRTIAAATGSSSRNRGVLLLACAFGVLSALLMFAYLNSRGGETDLSGELFAGEGAETVVVMTRDVAVGEKITSDMLTTRTMPAAALLPGRVKDSELSSLVGKVATAPMYAGEQVIDAKVTTYVGQDTLAYKVPQGMRAISLQVPHEAWIAAGLPQPGDRVDILGITTLSKVDPLTGEEKPNVVAGYIAQDVEVLAVAQTVVKTVPKVDGGSASTETAADGSAPVSATSQGAVKQENATYEKAISITLALPPDLAAKVALIDAMRDDVGQYRILPRQKGDADPITGKQVWTYDDLFPVR
ncbi:Flp pilus assembly protein CpaB [Tepidiforma sp.]|uniref:Flp pilus assembly protein CpaB n=1 Tax=Tepidiforma sp. TaxID=2682230 RepID=UPI002ADDBEBE|nr:Flp pilus assembly protein CpaB [Tepidiforma sp.]